VTQITRSCLLLVPVERAYQEVADVERYPDFLPACKSVAILERRVDAHQVEWVDAQVTVGKAGAEYEFVTENQGVLNQRIEVQLKRGLLSVYTACGHSKPWAKRAAVSSLVWNLRQLACWLAC